MSDCCAELRQQLGEVIRRLDALKTDPKGKVDQDIQRQIDQLVRMLNTRFERNETAINNLNAVVIQLIEQNKSIKVVLTEQAQTNKYFAANFDAILGTE